LKAARWRDQAGQHWLFFRQWVRAPLSTASVVPSSRALAEKMVAQVGRDARHIIELGAGTGVFTEALLERQHRLEQLLVVELNPQMHAQLCHRFPTANVVLGNAAALEQIVASKTQFGSAGADAVISGLGLLNMPPAVVSAILSSAFAVLKPGAPFIQFTYGPSCPVRREMREELGLTSERVAFTLRNIPPASVYVLRKR
jgi:phosphatidylethanolamine/phosphatidyl-N-methylethanolamine N-methyltransferase